MQSCILVLDVGLAGLGLLGTQWLNKITFLAPLLARLPPVLLGASGVEGGFQPNEVAGSLLGVLPALLIVTLELFRRRLNRRRLLALVVSLCATLFVLGIFTLTQSRSGYIGLTVSVSLRLVIRRGNTPLLAAGMRAKRFCFGF